MFARRGAWLQASAQLRAAVALEDRVDADLHLGLHDEVIVELQKLVSAEPMRKRLWCLLMLALYRAGRQADSLAAYREARRVLVSELAIEPGPELRQLHGQIQRADPALILQPVTSAHLAGGRAAPVIPRQLPAAPAHFTGRAASWRP